MESRGISSIFRDRPARWYLSGQLISLSGTWMQSVAQGWLVYTLTGSTFWLAMVAVALTAPVLLFSLAGGTVADRFDRRKLLIVTQLLLVVPALLLGLLTQAGMVTAGWVVGLAILTGTLNAFDLPARQAFWGSMVRAEKLLGALSLNAIVFNATRIIGPVIAGFVIATWGSAACFYLNAASYLIGIVTLLMIGHRAGTVRQEVGISKSGVFQELQEGLRYVASRRELSRLLLLVAAVSLFGISFVSLLPVFADGILHVGPQGLGLLASASGAGSLAGAVLLLMRGEVRCKGRIIVVAGLMVAVGLFIFAMSRDYHESIAALLMIGAGVVSLLALVNCLLQRHCPDDLRGRVMALYTLALVGTAPFGHAMIGFLAGTVGVVGALAVCSSICLTVVLVTARPISRLV